MTDTQESVVINQNTNGQRLRRLVNGYIAREWSFYKTIAAVVVVGAILSHYHAINSQEAIQKLEIKMVKEFGVLRGLLGR